jgi:predicted XRE-type DNA-binding protein
VSPTVAALRATLGDAIGYMLKTSGMSQQEAATACGVHQTNVSAAIRAKSCTIEKQIDLLSGLGYRVELRVIKNEN